MKAVERLYAKNKAKEIHLAIQSRKIVDMAKALDINLNDPEWSNMPFTEAAQVMQVRLSDMLRRMSELGLLK